MVEGILVEGLIYGILALGVFVSFRILDFPDLTVEGSFPAGAAAGAVVASALNLSPNGFLHALAVPAGMLAGFVAGGVAGFATAAVYHKLRVPPLLAGIVTMTGFYSINLRILGGKPNYPLITNNPMLKLARSFLGGTLPSEWSLFASCVLVCLLLFALLDLFFHTEIGIAMGALGDNENAVVQAGIQPNRLRTWGIMLANALPGLSGAMAAAYQGFADVNLGQGVVAAGLATVMLGELIIHSQFISIQLLRVFFGSILFRALMYAARSWGYVAGITPNDLRLLTALLIIASVALSRVKRKRS
ncbi:MAG: beta-methylgalactoside transporter inner membrane component [Spirochaetes bacterium ADurb.Bin110]|nr:MAG: beta-methylgalactoside transporter inner membrane component [Spirochaetes bacterium ADurb.Bin110]